MSFLKLFYAASFWMLTALIGPLAIAAPIISYQTLPDRIRKQNPDLAAARFRIAEARGRLNQAGRLTNPDLNIEASQNNRFRERSLTVRFSQKFPVTNRLRLEKEVGAINLRAAQAEVKEVERQLVAEARQALVDFLALRKRRHLREAQIKLAEELSASVEALMKKGEVSQLEAGIVKLEALEFKTEIRQLDAQEKALNGVIKPLLGMPLEAPLIVGGDLNAMNTPLLMVDLTRRGDVRVAMLEVETAAKQLELEQARRYDDIEASVFTSLERTEDVPAGFENEGIIGIGFTIPLPFWNKNEGNIEEAKARKERKKRELSALEKRTLHQIKATREEMVEWAKLIREIDQTLLPEAKKQSDLVHKAYQEGIVDLQTMLRSREKKLRLEDSRLNALKSFHKARAQYESTLGL